MKERMCEWSSQALQTLKYRQDLTNRRGDESSDDCAPPADNFSEDSEASEEVPSCDLAELTAMHEEIGVHAVAGRRSAHQAALAFAQDKKVGP